MSKHVYIRVCPCYKHAANMDIHGANAMMSIYTASSKHAALAQHSSAVETAMFTNTKQTRVCFCHGKAPRVCSSHKHVFAFVVENWYEYKHTTNTCLLLLSKRGLTVGVWVASQ